jgi:hypothetical protein
MHEIAFAFLQSVLCVTRLVKFWLGLGRLSTPSLHLYGTRQKRPRWPNAGCTRCVRHCTYAGPPRRTAGRLALALPGRPACPPAQVHSRSSQVQGGNPTKAGALTLCAPGRCPVRQSQGARCFAIRPSPLGTCSIGRLAWQARRPIRCGKRLSSATSRRPHRENPPPAPLFDGSRAEARRPAARRHLFDDWQPPSKGSSRRTVGCRGAECQAIEPLGQLLELPMPPRLKRTPEVTRWPPSLLTNPTARDGRYNGQPPRRL